MTVPPISSESTDAINRAVPEANTSPSLGQRWRNLLIVLVAVTLSVLVVLGIRTETPAASLEALALDSVPLESALINGKPSLVEFYANWCTSCQAMAGEMANLREGYRDRVNFVMLNIDNSKWLPEMLSYRVDGIPHFVYLDDRGETVSMAIGEQPQTILSSNLDALLSGESLPYEQHTGRTSELETPPSIRSDNPRSHGAQASS
ncbi:thioredoxin family protein [Leptolyngbya sp. PCC 6406]|uniref:thioredoxin family protein n=1 Tax=Leptolyngbya sp. PCC 6406 TaxID=1173264 RepID=UPI0002F2176F|nr:thioredoxin family protein [Leptolyngbya sp. PCC 6406]